MNTDTPVLKYFFLGQNSMSSSCDIHAHAHWIYTSTDTHAYMHTQMFILLNIVKKQYYS